MLLRTVWRPWRMMANYSAWSIFIHCTRLAWKRLSKRFNDAASITVFRIPSDKPVGWSIHRQIAVSVPWATMIRR